MSEFTEREAQMQADVQARQADLEARRAAAEDEIRDRRREEFYLIETAIDDAERVLADAEEALRLAKSNLDLYNKSVATEVRLAVWE